MSSMQSNSLESAYYLCRPEKNPQNQGNGKPGAASNLSIVQQYIQHLFLERVPKAASYHSKTLSAVEQGDESIKHDIDSVVSYILTI